MSQTALHYLYDPLCGWCYGAAPLIKASRELIAIQAHAGGMMAGAQRRAVTPALREFVVGHDQRIAQASGQTFGEAYINGLLRDSRAVLDSGPPITAVLAAGQVDNRELDLLARLQTAHYVEGLKIADPRVLNSLAVEIGLDGPAFEQAFAQLKGAATQTHIEDTRALMAKVGAHGFPSVVLERNGTFKPLNITAYFRRLDGWRALLKRELAMLDESVPAGGEGLACGLDGCTP